MKRKCTKLSSPFLEEDAEEPEVACLLQAPCCRREIRNPGKSLQARTDLKDSQSLSTLAEKDSPTPTRRPHSLTSNNKQSHLATEALAWLAAKEDFSAAQLRKNSANLSTPKLKVCRYCRPRLIEPVAASVNSGDAYVLITPPTPSTGYAGFPK